MTLFYVVSCKYQFLGREVVRLARRNCHNNGDFLNLLLISEADPKSFVWFSSRNMSFKVERQHFLVSSRVHPEQR